MRSLPACTTSVRSNWSTLSGILEETKARDQGEVAPVIRQQCQVVFEGRRGNKEIHVAGLPTMAPWIDQCFRYHSTEGRLAVWRRSVR